MHASRILINFDVNSTVTLYPVAVPTENNEVSCLSSSLVNYLIEQSWRIVDCTTAQERNKREIVDDEPRENYCCSKFHEIIQSHTDDSRQISEIIVVNIKIIIFKSLSKFVISVLKNPQIWKGHVHFFHHLGL